MYGIFNIALDSDIPLPELPEAETYTSIIRVSSGANPAHQQDNDKWSHHWETPEGEICASLLVSGQSYLLRFPHSADFAISRSCDFVEYFPEPDIPPETIRHLLLDQVIPRCLGQLGNLVLHASAVVLPGGEMIAFLGDSGWGKSTLASSFHQHGAQLITDDCLMIREEKGQVFGIPNYYGVRLFEESVHAIFGAGHETTDVSHYTDKKRLILKENERHFQNNDTSLKALFILNNPDSDENSSCVRIDLIGGAADLMAVIKQIFLLDISDKKLIADQFDNVGKVLAAGTKLYKISYPREYSSLSDIRMAVIDCCSK